MTPDWSLLQSFVAVVEAGSLSKAANMTGGSQPTMSRHISLLEDEMGTRLLERSKSGAKLTEAGAALYDHAKTMADAATRISYLAEGADQRLEGTVRITASNIVATFVLPDILAHLHAQEPGIAVELVASDETDNLLRREADIAVRMYRPTQLDVIARHIGDWPLGAYAAKTYLETHGVPQTFDDLRQHTIVGYDRNTLVIDGFRAAGMDVDRDFFAFRSDNQVVCWQMVVAGFGIGFNQRFTSDADDRVESIETMGDIGTIPVWLTAHNELNRNPRIRFVYDFLAQSLCEITSEVSNRV